MKHLPLIFVAGLILSACNNDKSNIIINVNMIGENSYSIQKVIDNSLNNDTAKVININIYNIDEKTKKEIKDNTISNQIDSNDPNLKEYLDSLDNASKVV